MIQVPVCGAIDLGGTKIEARLFGADLTGLETCRIATPVETFSDFLEGLKTQIRWLCDRGGRPDLPIGICIPGTVDPETGEAFASNIPITGRDIGADLQEHLGRKFALANDCMALALSEARGGAGTGERSVVGLVIGTGVGAGWCIDGQLPHRRAGLPIEIGHVAMSPDLLKKYGLPLSKCGCGRTACMERYMAGSAFGRLSEWLTGSRVEGEALVQRALSGDAEMMRILDIWTDLASEGLLTLQLMLDPDCIVIGGGASRIPGIAERMERSLNTRRFGTAQPPKIRIAQHGDSSGARGMALLALQQEGL